MLFQKCLTKVLKRKFHFIAGLDENEEKLVTWSSKSTKLLISLRREKTHLFDNGKVRKKVAWEKVAEQFNANSSVRVTGEQCANKWKKLEEKYKKVSEHNAKTGNDKKECEFEDELSEFFRSDPKIIPPTTVSSLPTVSAGSQSTHEGEESPLANAVPREKRKRRSKSSAAEIIEFLTEFKEEKRKEEQQKFDLAERMHEEKMGVMARFLDILSKKV